jgi:hypothetical protein
MINRLDALQERLVVAVPPEVTLTREDIAGVNRLRATRHLNDGSERDLLITWVGSPDSPHGLDVFSILGAWYGNHDPSQNTDGRQWGNADHVLQIVIEWLVELRDDWTSLPRAR